MRGNSYPVSATYTGSRGSRSFRRTCNLAPSGRTAAPCYTTRRAPARHSSRRRLESRNAPRSPARVRRPARAAPAPPRPRAARPSSSTVPPRQARRRAGRTAGCDLDRAAGGDAHGAPGRCGQTREAGADSQHRPHAARQHSKAYSGASRSRSWTRARCPSTTPSRSGCRPPRGVGPVTLRQLLNHTSGLPDYTEAETSRRLSAAIRTHFGPRQAARLRGDEPLLFPPGSQLRYSNSDNIVVALMAEQATGQPYDQLSGGLIFRPLGLSDTSLPEASGCRGRTCTATTTRATRPRTSARY